VASEPLRPLAQRLDQTRSPAAYAAVRHYAWTHHGEAAAAAWLALGHAYLLDHKYANAVVALRFAHRADGVLSDYTDYLTAQAYLQNNQLPQAEEILAGFERKHPGSIFDDSIPTLEANLFLQENDPQRALAVLNRYAGEAVAGRSGFQLALAKAEQMAGNTARADYLFRHVYLDYPLSAEASVAKTQLAKAGILDTLPLAERQRHADALYRAGRYAEAGNDYRTLAADYDRNSAERTALLVAAADCDWKLGRLTQWELDQIPQTGDEAGARRLYLDMSLARDRGDTDRQKWIVGDMERRFPYSVWLEQALFSSGNMYLLRKDYPTAIVYYSELAKRFPQSELAATSHWRAAWLEYRLGDYTEAARMFDAELRLYPDSVEASSALYWRGRIFQVQQHDPAVAAAYYRAVARAYPHYYHAMLAEQRLKQMRHVRPEEIAFLDRFQRQRIPELTDDIPEDNPHVVKAKLLANAGLNEYIAPEIQEAEGSARWGAFAEARIFAADGENWRAMQLLKQKLPFYTTSPIDALPMAYWRILFPRPYWSYITADAKKNGLNPYMVASLIRQETEFNPRAVSGKSAYGLMQLLPRVGRQMAREEGIRYFRTSDLLNPRINILLGTRYLRLMLDKFDDKPEYAFAAYNAGDYRVVDWENDGSYSGMDEFVESIPFTQTRNYVQAIIRNEAIYRELDEVSAQEAKN
jgi:soluble lytic murein transglycosylase